MRNISWLARSSGRGWRPAGSVLFVALSAGAVTGAVALPMKPIATGRLTGTVVIEGLTDADGAVVYLEPVETEETTLSGATAVIDQKGLDFRPRILVVQVGTTVEFHNSDTVLHNIFAPDLGSDPRGEAFDLGTWPAGESKSHRFTCVGVTTLLCNVHPEMEAFVVVVPTQHYALTGADGKFVIADVPAGDYVVHVWHERCRSIRQRIRVEPGGSQQLQLVLRIGAG